MGAKLIVSANTLITRLKDCLPQDVDQVQNKK